MNQMYIFGVQCTNCATKFGWKNPKAVPVDKYYVTCPYCEVTARIGKSFINLGSWDRLDKFGLFYDNNIKDYYIGSCYD